MEELSIHGVSPLLEQRSVHPLSGPEQGGEQGFLSMLNGAIEEVNRLGHEAGRLEDAVAKGENVSIHQAIIAGEKAGLSFQLMMQVRNKLLEAYQEVSRMQI